MSLVGDEARKKEKIDEVLEMRGRSWLGDHNRGDVVVNMHGEAVGRLVSILNRQTKWQIAHCG